MLMWDKRQRGYRAIGFGWGPRRLRSNRDYAAVGSSRRTGRSPPQCS
jgi:hypothetical protein